MEKKKFPAEGLKEAAQQNEIANVSPALNADADIVHNNQEEEEAEQQPPAQEVKEGMAKKAPTAKSLNQEAELDPWKKPVLFPKALLRQARTGVRMLMEASLSVLQGVSKTCKSTFAAIESAALLSDKPEGFMGMKAEKQGARVAIVDTEMGPYGLMMMKRIYHMLGWPFHPEGTKSDRFSYYDYGIYTRDKRWKMLEELIEEGGYDLVIVDGISDLMTSDTNNLPESQRLVDDLGVLARKNGVCVQCILHTNRGNVTAAKGHLGKILTEKATTSYLLERVETGTAEEGRPYFRVTPQAGGFRGAGCEDFEPINFRFSSGSEQDLAIPELAPEIGLMMEKAASITKKETALERQTRWAREVFSQSGMDIVERRQLIAGIVKAAKRLDGRDISKESARDFPKKLVTAGVLSQDTSQGITTYSLTEAYRLLEEEKEGCHKDTEKVSQIVKLTKKENDYE